MRHRQMLEQKLLLCTADLLEILENLTVPLPVCAKVLKVTVYLNSFIRHLKLSLNKTKVNYLNTIITYTITHS